jgi:hypothetical protein
MHIATRVRTWRVPRLYSAQCTVQWNSCISETVRNRTHVHYIFRLEWPILWPPRILTSPRGTSYVGQRVISHSSKTIVPPNCMVLQRNDSENGGGMFHFYMHLQDCTMSQLTSPKFSRLPVLDVIMYVKYGRQHYYGKTLAVLEIVQCLRRVMWAFVPT